MSRQVLDAIDRWLRDGLIDGDLAGRLSTEAVDAEGAATRRIRRYMLAGTGAVVLVIAGGLFLDWAWPLLGEGGRATLLGVIGLGVVLFGLRVEHRRRWLPAAILAQTGGLGLVMAAVLYGNRAWDDMSTGAIASSALGLAVPVALAPGAIRRNVVMPSVHFAYALGFLAVFLLRATPVSDDAVVWLVDVALLLAVLGLVRVMTRDPRGERHPWALNAFVTGMLAGFLMVVLTGTGPLGMEAEVMYPLDLWHWLTAALAIWGIQRGPWNEARDGFVGLLALLILAWIPMGFVTALETIDGPPELALFLVSGMGVAGFLYGSRYEISGVLATSALAFIAGVWYWAVDRGGTLGAVLALAVTAVLLFVMSGRSDGSEGDDGVSEAS